jgi:tetratricopeptide (TPR) repeat protein
MVNVFTGTTGALAERLLKSLRAGEQTGGQIDGKQSAALVVKRLNDPWYDRVDLRVDHSSDPFSNIERLYGFYQGRRELDLAAQYFMKNRIVEGKQLVLSAERKLAGFTGMYEQLIASFIFLGDTGKAVEWIKRALSEEPKWRHNLPAFHILAGHPELPGLIDENKFTLKDWYKAITMYYDLGSIEDGISLAAQLIRTGGGDAYAHFLLGKGYALNGNVNEAKACLVRSAALEPDNPEVAQLLKSLA